MKEYHTLELILKFLTSILWPLVTIIIFTFLRKPITNLINNIKKIGYGNTGIETNISSNQKADSSFIDILGDGNDESYLDNIMTKFSESTFEQIEESIENETKISTVDGFQNKFERMHKYAKLLVLIKNAEKIYDLIYGSQIRLLQRLNHTNSETKSSLKLYYDNAVNVYPLAYEKYSYENYLNFLYNYGLIILEENNENVKITTSGKDFLRYLIEANLSLEKHY